MSELTTWLLEQVAADEAAAQAATPGPWSCDESGGVNDLHFGHVAMPVLRPLGTYGPKVEDVRHIARHDPARVLAERAAKRRIVELADDASHTIGGLEQEDDWEAAAGWAEQRAALEPILRALANIYAGQDGWREEWA